MNCFEWEANTKFLTMESEKRGTGKPLSKKFVRGKPGWEETMVIEEGWRACRLHITWVSPSRRFGRLAIPSHHPKESSSRVVCRSAALGQPSEVQSNKKKHSRTKGDPNFLYKISTLQIFSSIQQFY